MVSKWGGRRAQAWSAAVLAKYGTACHIRGTRCTGLATTGDHVIPRSVRPDLQYDVTNGRPACASCNKQRKAKPLDGGSVIDNRAFFEILPATGKDSAQSPPRDPENS